MSFHQSYETDSMLIPKYTRHNPHLFTELELKWELNHALNYSGSILLGAHFYSARNAHIASAVLATAIPSVCLSVRPSVTRRYCVKTTARSTMQFSPLDSKMCLVL